MPPMSISAWHCGAFGAAGVHTVNPDCLLCGTLNTAMPFVAFVPSPFVASVDKFSCTKLSPGRVTRTAPAFGMVSALGNPPGNGWMPQAVHPLEQPPPLQDATR